MQLTTQNDKKVYSDGDTVEQRMLEIARKYPEDQAEEYIAQNYDYTTNNTFSSVRKNLLNWYPFAPNSTVLEIGAGMGAMTGLLCDKCAHVTAVEMNAVRADVIRARYAKRKNLTVLTNNIQELPNETKYDYVVFVGALEYAAIFSDAVEPFRDFIVDAAKFLKADGTLLFAIENQYGVKYWCGAAEDHLQEPFAGIKGYKKEKTARTFSKAALERLVEEAGLKQHRIYGVLPDYKFPTYIFSEEYKPTASDMKNIAYTYGKNSLLVADEKSIYQDLTDNDVLMFFANSFLVEASAEQLNANAPLLVTARGENKAEYRIITAIYPDKTVAKQAAHSKAQKHLLQMAENERVLANRGVHVFQGELKNGVWTRPFYNLRRADTCFSEYLKHAELNEVWKMVEELRENLLKSSEISFDADNALVQRGIASPDESFGAILEHGYVDMTFYNAFVDENRLVFFDQEWMIPKLPLEFILYYAVKSVFQRCGSTSAISFETVTKHLNISKSHQRMYDALEEEIWKPLFLRQGDFYGEGGYCTQYYTTPKIEQLIEHSDALERENQQLNINLQAQLNSNKQLVKQTEQKQKDNIFLQQKLFAVQETNTSLTQQLNNKQGHIELLLESDRELERIKNSRSWRYMGYVWKIRDVLIPCGSKRRMLGKIIVKFVKHPIRFIGKCSPARIHKFFITLRREGTEGVSRRLDDCLIGNNIQTTQLVLNEVDLAAQKTADDYEVLYVPAQDKPVISIVIPVYNQFEYTYLCIKSILENSGDVAYEIIIADDCSTDLTTEIDEIIHGVHTIHNESNLRFLRNCNNAAKQARGQYILFLNNDTQVQADWLAPLIELIERDDSIGMVGSKLVYPDGRLQEAGGILWQDGSAWNYGNRANPDEPEFNYVKEADYISGAAIMIRKSLWEEIGGFDERFVPAYCEDSDLAFEVRKHGCKVMYQPKSVVVHFEGVSNGTDTTSGQKAYQVTNQKKFLEKWQQELQENHLPNAVDPFRARERSVHKKILLMVDHYVPHYDKDAGSRTVYQYLQLFVNQGFSVKFIGDNFFAHQPYTDALQQMGVEVLYGPYYAKHWKDWLKENGKDIGYVFLNRPHISVKYIDAVREFTNARVIYYGHDLHFLREKREYELTGDAALLQSSADWEKKELELILAADMAYYPSYVEEQAIHEIAPQAKVKAIPAYLFSDVEECEYHFDKRKDLMFIGGFGHRPNVDAVKWLANEIMHALVKKLPDIRVYILGSNPPEEVKQLATENLLIKGFVTDEELQEYYQNCRISIVPLRYGAGIKGKVIEAMRFGTPVMTTSVGAEGIKGAESILDIADEAADFVEQLAALYQNEAELVRRSKASYQYIRDNFSFENAKKVIGPEFDLE